jgi:hypothetical protein
MTTYKSLISGYIGSGTFAARPVAATIAADLPPGTASSYFATDTGVLYQVDGMDGNHSRWSGTPWRTLDSSPSVSIHDLQSRHSIPYRQQLRHRN